MYLINYFDLISDFKIAVNYCCFLGLLESYSYQLVGEQFVTATVAVAITNFIVTTHNYFENAHLDHLDWRSHFQINRNFTAQRFNSLEYFILIHQRRSYSTNHWKYVHFF